MKPTRSTEPTWLKLLSIVLPMVGIAWVLLSPTVLSHDAWERWVHSEWGLLEKGTVLMLLPTSALFAWLAWRGVSLGRWVRGWYALLSLGFFYFAGEEASWGQHLLGFTPPPAIADRNLQGEFNLHNADAWFHDLLNEVPRTIAGFFCLVVAGILPWVFRKQRARPSQQDAAWTWVLPSVWCSMAGLLAWSCNLPAKLLKDTSYDGPGHWAYYALIEINDELKENLIAATVLLYALWAWQRFRATRAARVAAPSSEGAPMDGHQ